MEIVLLVIIVHLDKFHQHLPIRNVNRDTSARKPVKITTFVTPEPTSLTPVKENVLIVHQVIIVILTRRLLINRAVEIAQVMVLLIQLYVRPDTIVRGTQRPMHNILVNRDTSEIDLDCNHTMIAIRVHQAITVIDKL